MLHIIHHEVNHAIQNKNVTQTNVDEDEDILEYAKDMVLSFEIDLTFSKKNYLSIAEEFDADFKAMIQTAILLKEEDSLFEESAKAFNRCLQESKIDLQNYRYKRNFKRGEKSLAQYFDDTIELNDLISVKDKYPILGYDYDFNTGKRYTIEELLIKMKKSEGKDRRIYKCVIKSRCNAYKEGEEKASENLKKLKEMLKDDNKEEIGLITEIENVKSEIDKYEKLYQKWVESMKNHVDKNVKAVSSSRRY